MKHTHGEGVLFVALLVAFAACADPASRTVGVSASKNILSPSESPAPGEERAALTKIARLVAVSLDNEPARQHLKRDMRAAPFREHKLELGPYLRSKDAKALLSRMVALNGGTETDLFATLSTIRRLEFYMPVASHREKWTGSSDVLVVSQLDQPTPIVAFDEKGAEVTLDRSAPPEQPTLSILPVETRFDQPMPINASKNVRDENGSAIGTLERLSVKSASLVACDPDCGGGGSVQAPPPPPGLYLEFSRIVDAKEPWFRGDPEIEVHIHGPNEAGAPRYGRDLSCSGEHAYDYRKVFDQNTGFWQGRVLLFSADETAAYFSKFPEGFHMIFWEDDNDQCTIKIDTNALLAFLHSTASATGTVAIKLLPSASWKIVAAAFFATFFDSASWLQTDDDFLGVAVDQRSIGSPYPDNTHAIMDGTNVNGRATIIYRQ
jgi:hypothetical protein